MGAQGCGGGCPEGSVPRGDGCVLVGTDAPIDAPGLDAPSDGGAPEDMGDAFVADSAECVPAVEDPIDLEGLDTNCDGVDGIAGEQVYVALTGDDGNAGTMTSPVRTLVRALTIAAGRPVVMATGT